MEYLTGHWVCLSVLVGMSLRVCVQLILVMILVGDNLAVDMLCWEGVV